MSRPIDLKMTGSPISPASIRFHRRRVSGIVTAHETNLQVDTSFDNRIQSCVRVSEVRCQRFFRKNVLSSCGCGADRLSVELVGCGNHDAVDVLVCEHVLEATE